MTTLSPPVRVAGLGVPDAALRMPAEIQEPARPPTTVEAPRRSAFRRPTTTEAVAEIALVLIALCASLGVARLIQGGLGHRVLLPMFASVAAGAIVTAICARTKLNLAAVSAIGIVVTALVVIWVVSPSATRLGLPVITTFHVLSREISQARAVMGSHKTPVPAVSGVVLIASLCAGVVAVAARALWELARRSRRHWPKLLAIVPTLGMFCYAAPLSARIDRPQVTIAFFGSVLLFVAASDATGRTLRHVGSYGRARSGLAAVVPGVTSAATALLVLLLAAAALSGTNPLPFPWWSAPSGPGGYLVPGQQDQSGVTALSLVANLRGDETTKGDVEMFTVTSPVPTYWQVGVLTIFNGSSWLPDAAENAALEGKPPGNLPSPPLPPPYPTAGFNASISIDHFTGRLLPAPPLAQAIDSGSSAVQSATIIDGIGVTVSSPISQGQTYTVESGIATAPDISEGPATLADIYAGLGNSGSELLTLPPGVPQQVHAIAESIVAGTKTPLEEVQALVNYFRTGTFTYTLTPPPAPPGENPLIWFLNDRQGFCQQFAGAFGVLARELGIPVRLAVGFTLGHASGSGPDTYTVTGADAHVWPEVYMGQGLGWVSVDPTPGGVYLTEAKIPSVMGFHALAGGKSKTGGKSGKTAPKHTFPTVPKDRVNTSTPSVAHHKKSAPFPAGLVVWGVVVFLGACGFGIYLRRSRRSARGGLVFRHSGDPDHVVVRSWLRAADALGRAGFRRSVSTTPIAHAEAVREAVNSEASAIGKRSDSVAALGTATYGYTELAEMAEVACYAPGHCSERDARVAQQEAWRIERALRTAGMFRRFPTQFPVIEPEPVRARR